jgi:hypothetical protein
MEVLACRIVVLWAYDMCVLWGAKCTICRAVKSTMVECLIWYNFNNFNNYNKATIKVVLVCISWSET